MENLRNANKILVGNPAGKRPVVRTRHRGEANTEI
jgi:hypothetical protein